METIKLIQVIGIALTIQSCNMAKFYGNMRINHNKKDYIAEQDTLQGSTYKINRESLKNEIGISTTADNDSVNSLATESVFTLKKICSAGTKNKKPLLNKQFKNTLNKPAFASYKSTKIIQKNLKKHILNPMKKISATKWIDVDAKLTVIYILLGVALLILILGSLFTFSEVGIILLYILLGAAIIFAGAMALGLLLMGFLRMCGLDW